MAEAKVGDGRITISKKYERKVNLSAISSQYDNISISTFVSMEIEQDASIEEAMKALFSIVYHETENDIRNTMLSLSEKSQDKANHAFLGIPGGRIKSIENKTETKEEDSSDSLVDDVFKDDEEIVITGKSKSKEPVILEEEPLDTFNFDDYQGDLN